MANKPEIALFTSIPPKLHRMAGTTEYGEAYQKECINSWISAGFRVFSINSRTEIALLERQHPQVRFLESGSEDVRTKIDIFLRSIASLGEPISGIINADCYLLDHGAVIDTIETHARDSLVLMRRLNLCPATLRPTGQTFPGFDGFIFDTRFLPQIEAIGNWAIGTPWWDYWFPVAMYLAGARLRSLDVALLLHLNHSQRWREEDCNAEASYLWDVLVDHSKKMNLGKTLQQGTVLCDVDLSIQDRKVEQIAERIVPWINRQSEVIHLSHDAIDGNFLSRVLMALEGSQEASLQHQLDTVTFPKWLRSKRRALYRVGHKIQSLVLPLPLRRRKARV